MASDYRGEEASLVLRIERARDALSEQHQAARTGEHARGRFARGMYRSARALAGMWHRLTSTEKARVARLRNTAERLEQLVDERGATTA